ncbi:MAG: cytochrome C [Sphingomonas sp. SCN 67-18]|uniref:c-type cytochrome n=1 Tax=uncultured Sphingomonas sp. TaxID=158754 RepID=UPI00086A826E|nr:c-type cytochrome [Sphingomonas sp. SCN 67-18]ODU20996.1 MAG: cytochrome C [Sphingomonas sp. SCN 67-18]
MPLFLAVIVGVNGDAMAADVSKPLPGDARRGAALYETKCGACHSLDANRIGPSHRGVFGRKSGAVPKFAYSPALKKANLSWNAATLDRWLANPVATVPGTRMGFRLPAPQDRADVIAYLKSVSPAR